MRVYFEVTGWGSNGNGKFTLNLSVYVKPQKDGAAYKYDKYGGLYQFKWADPNKSRIYDSSELPSKMWYSIRHGVCDMEVDADLATNWSLEDLKYYEVTKEEVKARKIVRTKIDNVKTIEDFKALYPTIRMSKIISDRVIDKVFELHGLSAVDVSNAKNGEIGVRFFHKLAYFNEILGTLGLEKIWAN